MSAGFPVPTPGQPTSSGGGGGSVDPNTVVAESDTDGQRVPIKDANGVVKGYVGWSEGGAGVAVWAGDVDGASNYDDPMMVVYPDAGIYFTVGPDSSDFVDFGSGGAVQIGGASAGLRVARAGSPATRIEGDFLSFFGGAGIDGTAAPTNTAALADVLMDLGIIDSHTVSASGGETRMWLPANLFQTVGSSVATKTQIANQTVVWSMPDNLTTYVSVDALIPSDWTTYSATLHWASSVAGTTNAIFQLDRLIRGAGANLGAAMTPGTTRVAATAGQNIVVATTMDTNIAAPTAGNPVTLHLGRFAGAGGDTVNAAVYVAGMMLTKVS